MPILLTFDLSNAEQSAHNRLQSMFQRFGWEALGGSAFRYPKLGSDESTEDWFNRVVPALMLFRAFAVKTGCVSRYSLDVQSSTGHNPERGYGHAAVCGSDMALKWPSVQQFGEKNLREWIDAVKWPY